MNTSSPYPSFAERAAWRDPYREEEQFVVELGKKWPTTPFRHDAGTVAWVDGPAAEDVAALALACGLSLHSVMTTFTSVEFNPVRHLGEGRDDVDAFDRYGCAAMALPVGWVSCHRHVSRRAHADVLARVVAG